MVFGCIFKWCKEFFAFFEFHKSPLYYIFLNLYDLMYFYSRLHLDPTSTLVKTHLVDIKKHTKMHP